MAALLLLSSSGMVFPIDDVDRAVCDAYSNPEEKRECYKELSGEKAPKAQRGDIVRLSGSSQPGKSIGLPQGVQRRLKQHDINSDDVNRLYEKHITEWSSLSTKQKQTVAEASIILMDMETADNPVIFKKHTDAVVACMDLQEHGMNIQAKGATVMVGITGCSAKTYGRYCTICKD